jgi:hypothetical protein
MAGSFEIFRKYQRSLLVFVAILAMLAFFVLPPFLQMGSGLASGDQVVATWRGGELRESGIGRAVAMRSVLNQFLLDAVAASGRDPGRMRLLPDDEEDVVRTMLLAEEARANGLVVSNTAVNEFLGQWTNDMVAPAQFEELVARRRSGPFPVSQADLFDALRTVLLANRMERMFLTGFAGDPPGQRWDYFRRLEQAATVEVVPVVVERFADRVSPPAATTLQAFFDRYRDELPTARSPNPGFKEPHRVSFDYLVASRSALEEEALKQVTDEQVKAYYEANKEQRFKAPTTPPAEPEPAEPKPEEPKPDAAKPADDAKPAEPEAADVKSDEPKPADEPDAQDELDAGDVDVDDEEPQEATGQAAATDPAQASEAKSEAKPDDTPAAKPDEKPEAKPDAKPDDAPAAKPAEKPAETPEAKPAEKPADASEEKPVEPPPAAETAYEPLEKVADEIRKQLAAEEISKRIEAVFVAVSADVSRYAEDRALWQARVTSGAAPPAPPNVDTIAAKQGLTAGRLRRVDRSEAAAAGAIASSFEFARDPGSPMGFRQVNWLDQMFLPTAPLLRPIGSGGVTGDRYLSWKTEDEPAFAPTFEAKREDVERAWRIVEARPLARATAEAIVKAVGAGSLADAAAAQPEPRFEAVTAGPFTWLARGGQPFGSPPAPSQPEGLSMPGEEFMQAVFALEPGGTAVAFNEPRTVCYAIRLVSYEPDEEALRTMFLDTRTDQRRLAPIAQQEEVRAVDAWIGDIEKRYALTWKRPPRGR